VAVIPEGQSLPENGSATTGEQIEDIDTKEETKDPMWGGTPKLLMVHQLWLWKLDDSKSLEARRATIYLSLIFGLHVSGLTFCRYCHHLLPGSMSFGFREYLI